MKKDTQFREIDTHRYEICFPSPSKVKYVATNNSDDLRRELNHFRKKNATTLLRSVLTSTIGSLVSSFRLLGACSSTTTALERLRLWMLRPAADALSMLRDVHKK
mmetsp:Transcript_17206/g.47374  ORF Transcript_17206/g.47374 Transcript_17206/m.47374 type:complete len:105 (+) Transcript_17206:2951-3265(+)